MEEKLSTYMKQRGLEDFRATWQVLDKKSILIPYYESEGIKFYPVNYAQGIISL